MMFYRIKILVPLFILAAILESTLAPAAVIFVGNKHSIGEYTTAGRTINRSMVSGLHLTFGLALSGRDLFVANENSGTIGEYTVAGRIINAVLISHLDGPAGIAVSGHELFVANYRADTIGEYTTSGRGQRC